MMTSRMCLLLLLDFQDSARYRSLISLRAALDDDTKR
jgi:hypothetical protein